jgi:uncharacterized protein
MKKLKYLLIILTILFIPNVSASTNTYDRNDKKNYGVNKHWTIDDKNIDYVLKTPLVDANELIYDFSDILTDEEEQKYYQLFKEYKEKYNIDIVFLSYNLPYSVDSTNTEFATDFYDFNDFGIDFEAYSGVLLFRNTYEQDPYYDMLSFGEAQLYYSSDRMSNILDSLYHEIHNSYYSDALDEWLDELDHYYSKGKIKGYHVNKDSYLVKNFNPQILPILIVDIIITAIFIVVKVKKNKMVYKATNADLYLDNKSFKLLEHSDNLVKTHTTSWTESDSSSSGGGGGGGFSGGGHSGGGFSSGGGRHG